MNPGKAVVLYCSNTMHCFAFFIIIAGLLVNSEPTVGRYVTFIRNLFIPPQNLRYYKAIIFDRNQGEVNRGSYERAYGINGRYLVEIYGKGLSKKELQVLGYL